MISLLPHLTWFYSPDKTLNLVESSSLPVPYLYLCSRCGLRKMQGSDDWSHFQFMSAKVKWALNAVKLSYYIFLVHPSSSMTISQFFLFLHTSNNCFFHLAHKWWLAFYGKREFYTLTQVHLPASLHWSLYALLSILNEQPPFLFKKTLCLSLNLIPFLTHEGILLSHLYEQFSFYKNLGGLNLWLTSYAC